MLRLVFTICMIDSPDMCEQRDLLVYDEMPVMACVMGAMPELATWREAHPNWRISRWRCEDDQNMRSELRDQGDAHRVPVAAGSEATLPGAVAIATSR